MEDSPIITVVQGTGVVGALVAGFFMVMGPLIATPTPSGIFLVAAFGYPLLMFMTVFVAMWGMRTTLILSLLAIGCVGVMVTRFVGEESALTLLWILVVVGSPAIVQAINTGGALREASKTKSEME